MRVNSIPSAGAVSVSVIVIVACALSPVRAGSSEREGSGELGIYDTLSSVIETFARFLLPVNTPVGRESKIGLTDSPS